MKKEKRQKKNGKKDLTGPTLLEMSGYPTNQALTDS